MLNLTKSTFSHVPPGCGLIFVDEPLRQLNLQRLFEKICAETANRYRKGSGGAKAVDSLGFVPQTPKVGKHFRRKMP